MQLLTDAFRVCSFFQYRAIFQCLQLTPRLCGSNNHWSLSLSIITHDLYVSTLNAHNLWQLDVSLAFGLFYVQVFQWGFDECASRKVQRGFVPSSFELLSCFFYFDVLIKMTLSCYLPSSKENVTASTWMRSSYVNINNIPWCINLISKDRSLYCLLT